MNIKFAVYQYLIDDQTLVALFELESDALLCKEYLQNLKTYPEYEGFYIQEETYYENFNDYLIDVKSGK